MKKLPRALQPLAAFHQFIIYKLVPKSQLGKTEKLPVDHRTEKVFAAGIDWQNDPTAWTSAEQALAIVGNCGKGYGVGFLFTGNDPFWFIDIDNCIHETKLSEIAKHLMLRLEGAAIEISQSGAGLHIFGTGTVPEHACKNVAAGLELYTSRRFVALTGEAAIGNASKDCSDVMLSIVAHYFPPTVAVHSAEWTTESTADYTPFADDEKLIAKACSSKSVANKFTGRASFNDLWTNNIEALADTYAPDASSANQYDASSADMALASGLAFWTGRNCAHIENLMWCSALAREKWTKHRTYLRDTITRACSLQSLVYTAGERKRVSVEPVTVGICEPTAQIQEESFPDIKPNGRLKATNENLKYLIDGYGIKTTYNVHSNEANFDIPGLQKTEYGTNDVAIGEIISKAVRCGLPKQDLQKSILDLAYKNPKFPVRDYLSLLQWDGDDHISTLCSTLHVPDKCAQARNITVKLWLIQCVASADGAIQTPNKSALARFEYVLVLGGAQGLNKTKWFRALIPDSLKKYFKDGLSLDPTNRDSIKKATSFWVVELGEIDATFKHDKIAQLKAFLSETRDVYRVAYGRTENSYPRMTSFCGSVNEMRFLKDATGNRRYLPITPHKITLPQCAGVDISQVWAQAWHLYKSGEQWWPNDKQEAVIQAVRATVEQDHETVIGERLAECYGEFTVERKKLPGNSRKKSKEIACDIGIFNPSKQDFNDIRNWMERNNLDEFERPDSVKSSHQTNWKMPPRLKPFGLGVPR